MMISICHQVKNHVTLTTNMKKKTKIIYVGNPWLTGSTRKSIIISERDIRDKLTKFQSMVFNLLNSILKFEK